MVLLNLFVSSSDTSSERRLESTLTIDQLKDKLYPLTGIAPQHQRIYLYATADSKAPVAELRDGERTLDECGVIEWNAIQLENTDPTARPGEFNDTTNLDRFELTQEEYEARNDTVLAHLKANKLGRFADVPENLTFAPPPPASAPSDVVVGARCQLHSTPNDDSDRRGTVRYVGEAEIGKGGCWVGVELDEPTGKGDGSVEGRRYFTCRPSHGVFVRPDKITIGDFPEIDLFADSDDEI